MVLCKALMRLLSDILCTVLTVHIEKRCRLQEVQRNYTRLASFPVNIGEKKLHSLG